MPTPKGQPSNNPNGRPMLGKAKRPTLTVTVDAATMSTLRSYAERQGISLGLAVDAAARALENLAAMSTQVDI